MTNEIKNVPKLRFPEYSEEWEKKRLKDISKINPKLMNEFPSEFDYIDLESVYKGKINKVSRVTNENAPSRAQRVAQRGDVFFQTVRPYQQNNFVFLDDRYSTVVSTGYAQIRSNMNSFYIYNLLLTSTFLNKVLINCTGSNYPAINSNDLGNISIRISTNENEKQKIGEFFSKLDRQIELEEQKLSLLEEQKKGYMQKIFSQELRFKDENGEHYPNWKKITIKEVANLTAGKSKKNENTGKYIIMDMGTVTKNGTILTHKSTPYESDLLNKGDLVMPKDDIGGGHIIGKTAFIPDSHKYVLGDHVYRLEIKKCNSLFLHYYINSDIVNRSLKRKVTGSAQLGLNRKSVEEEVIKTPCLEEQEKIGILFNKIDNLIELQTNKIEQLKQRKQGLLQKMFI